MDIGLTGRNALVCGSTQGIGMACAQVLAEQGACVTLMARDREALGRVCASLPAPGGQEHDFLVADFTDADNVRSVIDANVSSGAVYHILINNTGGPPAGRAIDAEPEHFERGFRMHLICNQHLVRAIVPGMRAAGYGRIINIISTSVKAPIAGLGVSNTIRGAVASWGKTLAGELGPDGITVNNILPGYTDTARLQSLMERWAGEHGHTLEEEKRNSEQSIPARRLARPEEIGFAAAFLASPAAAYISGINLPVDGGRTPSL